VRVATPPPVGTAQVFVLTFESTRCGSRAWSENVTTVLQPGPPRYDVGVRVRGRGRVAREFLERFVESRT
jgi:hypothetical protein